jgi:hypothetical protein
VVVPAVPVIAPPGATVQVKVAACAAVALKPRDKAATNEVRAAAPRGLRIFRSLLIDVQRHFALP